MERKIPFEKGECYHIYTRGVEKRTVFTSDADRDRFLALLFICNNVNGVNIHNLLKKYGGEPLQILAQEDIEETLVDILAFAMMPNHIHLITHEKKPGGISKFMLKLMTAYSMYFNTKYDRSGPLFTRPFRSKHINSDEYFRWVFVYVHLNPIELFQSDWKEKGVLDPKGAATFLQSYAYGSFPDYFIGERAASRILAKNALPVEITDLHTMDDVLVEFSSKAPVDSKSLVY
ncbi:MAG TPA: transposase [Candidatus Paceibacterota bacterium]|nr:transposase [Candidatus Paceibacterota bacterium]